MRVFPFAVTVLLMAPIAAACIHGYAGTGDCSGTVIDVGGLGLVYWVIVGDTPDEAWGYLESNGVPGLQRGGCGPFWGWGADPCQTDHPAGPDLTIY